MDYFENEEFKQKEEQKKKRFIENTQKQMKYAKKLLTILFGVIGILFCLLGAVFFPLEELEMAIAFSSIGGFFILMSILFYIILSCIKITDKTYEKMINYSKKVGVSNINTISAYLEVYEEQLQKLEERVNELEAELKSLKRRNDFN